MVQVFDPFMIISDVWIAQAFAETSSLINSANIKFPLQDILVEKETGSAIVQFALAGYSLKDIDLTVDDNHICIEGKAQKLDSSKFDVFQREIKRGAFRQRIPVSSKFDLSKIEPTYRDGILSLKISLSEERKPKKIAIK